MINYLEIWKVMTNSSVLGSGADQMCSWSSGWPSTGESNLGWDDCNENQIMKEKQQGAVKKTSSSPGTRRPGAGADRGVSVGGTGRGCADDGGAGPAIVGLQSVAGAVPVRPFCLHVAPSPSPAAANVQRRCATRPVSCFFSAFLRRSCDNESVSSRRVWMYPKTRGMSSSTPGRKDIFYR